MNCHHHTFRIIPKHVVVNVCRYRLDLNTCYAINHKVVMFFQSTICGTYNSQMLAGFLFEIMYKFIPYMFCSCEVNVVPLILAVANLYVYKGLESEHQEISASVA